MTPFLQKPTVHNTAFEAARVSQMLLMMMISH